MGNVIIMQSEFLIVDHIFSVHNNTHKQQSYIIWIKSLYYTLVANSLCIVRQQLLGNSLHILSPYCMTISIRPIDRGPHWITFEQAHLP